MPHITNEQFLTQLSALYAASSEAHSVYVSTKRLSSGEAAMEAAPVPGGAQYAVLFRATDGREGAKRVKFGTVVTPAALPTFQASLEALLRTSLAASLRKRDKAKERRVDKARKEAAKKIDEAGGKVKVSGVGSKRGAGRRKRQRAVAKAAKVRAEKARSFAKGGAAATSAPATSTA